MSFEVPILFLVFNRPDTTRVVFEEIRKRKPRFLYVAADGARSHKPGEAELCKQVREIIDSGVDWDCEVKTLFREENLGCKGAVSSAVNWFFADVEEGIILEDDCLPSPSFFDYCAALLVKYRNDNSIIAINGCNFGFEYKEASYFFSRYMNVWGWASWRRAAQEIRYDIPEWEQKDKISYLRSCLRTGFPDMDLPWFEHWKHIFDSIASGKLDSWAFFWIYHQFESRKINILPAVNLVKNIGFDSNATHTTLLEHPAARLMINDIGLPLTLNENKTINKEYEEQSLKPVCYMYKRKPNSFYYKNMILRYFPFVRLLRGRK